MSKEFKGIRVFGKIGFIGFGRVMQELFVKPIPFRIPPLASRLDLVLEGCRYNEQQYSRRWAVLKRTAHCRDFWLAAVDVCLITRNLYSHSIVAGGFDEMS